MCALCARNGNIVVSSLTFVLGKLFVTPAPAARPKLLEFAGNPSDAGLEALVTALRGHPLFEQVRGVVHDVRLFGGLDAVLSAADQEHADNFRAAMSAIKGGEHDY